MGRKFTYQEVKDYVEKFDYELISNEYINASVHLEIKCNKDHVYKASFDRFRQGRRCPICRANEKGLAIIQKRDRIKNEYCDKNNIPLIRIPYYNIDKISDILTENVLNPLINQEKTSTTKSS